MAKIAWWLRYGNSPFTKINIQPFRKDNARTKREAGKVLSALCC